MYTNAPYPKTDFRYSQLALNVNFDAPPRRVARGHARVGRSLGDHQNPSWSRADCNEPAYASLV